MANISELTPATSAADADLLYLGTDIAGTPTDKKITVANLLQDTYQAGGTDVPVADGGTGASTAAGARTNLGAAASADLTSHTGNVSNPHSVTKAQVGLSAVPNTDATARANHTGTQLASTISDLQTQVSANSDVAANTAARHSHSNKALLDSYTQTEVNLADAVTKKHAHSNQAVLDATTASFTTADETKLDGVAIGATANDSDANLKNRANHTGTQSVTTLSDFTEAVEDAIGTKVVAGSNVTVSYNDTTGETTIAATGGGGGTNETNLSTTLAATTVTINSDTGTDAAIPAADNTNAGVMTAAMQTKLAGIATGATANSADATLLARANHTGTQAASTISDFDTEVSNNTDVAAATTHIANTSNPHSVTKTQVGLSNVENLKVNLVGTTAPTVNEDSGDGYAVGSRWFDTTNDKEYVCLDASSGAAVWIETTGAGGGGGITASSTDTFTNKTIDADGTGNVITNIGASEVKADLITGQTAETAIADDDLILISDTSASGALRKMTKANFVTGLGGGGASTPRWKIYDMADRIYGGDTNFSTAGTFAQARNSSWALARQTNGTSFGGAITYPAYGYGYAAGGFKKPSGTFFGWSNNTLSETGNWRYAWFHSGPAMSNYGTNTYNQVSILETISAASSTTQSSVGNGTSGTNTTLASSSIYQVPRVITWNQPTTAGGDVSFYVDGTLKNTHTSNQPTIAANSSFGALHITANNTATGQVQFNVGESSLYGDLY